MAVGAAVNFNLNALLADFMSNFGREWQRQGRVGALQSIAIVDQSPGRQYLYPEFVLFQRLFEAQGIASVIAAPEDLLHRDDALWCGGKPIDLVYNRLTDFYFERPESKMLRAAYLAGDVVVTPSPRVHALLANKENLTLLSDAKMLRKMGCGR